MQDSVGKIACQGLCWRNAVVPDHPIVSEWEVMVSQVGKAAVKPPADVVGWHMMAALTDPLLDTAIDSEGSEIQR